MNVFISWSGEASRSLAAKLDKWLPLIVQTAKPWFSPRSIEAGQRWSDEVAAELQRADFGIICVTSTNRNAPWLLFEAGALAKAMTESRVIPLLLDLDVRALDGPLAQFQAKKTDHDGLKDLVQLINLRSTDPMPEERLCQIFEWGWQDLERAIQAIPKETNSPTARSRPQGEVLEELVVTVRAIGSRVIGPPSPDFGGLNQAADYIRCAIRLFDKKTLVPFYGNRRALENKDLDERADRSVLESLARQLRRTDAHRADTLVWDAERHAWRRRRLFDCEYCYWLVDELEPVDGGADLSHWKLMAPGHHNWEARMGELGLLLQQDLGISRLRLYRVVQLYEPDATIRTYVMQPLWQRGGGFDPDVQAWLTHEYLLTDSIDASRAFGDEHPPWLIAAVDDRSPRKKGPVGVRFGRAKSRVDVPIEHLRRPSAMLAMDRRHDHLEGEYEGGKSIWGDEITEPDMERIGGLLDLIKPMLVNALNDRDMQRADAWNEKVTGIIARAVANPKAAEAFKAALDDVRDKWVAGPAKIRDAYLVKVWASGMLEPWAGSGPIWECRRGNVFSPTRPFSEALKQTHVIHDFQGWLPRLSETEALAMRAAFKANPHALDDVGSWLGIPLLRGLHVFGLLVFTVSQTHYFTVPRVNALESTATRLMPMLLWALAEHL